MSQSVVARGAGVAALNYVGANGQNVTYYTPEMPFLNIFKQAGNNSLTSLTGWFTATSGTGETGEEAYIQLDANGYPTSMTAVAGHTQTYTQLAVIINNTSSSILAPGATEFYPSGSYTLQFQGAGSMSFVGRDVISGLATSSPNVSIVGSVITSTQAAGITATVTFNIATPTNAGITFNLLTTTPGNAIKAISIVQTSLMTNYLAGQIFTPRYKAALANFSCFRALKALLVEIQDQQVSFGATLLVGATSGGMVTYNWNTSVWDPAPWTYPSGTYNIVFATGQVIACTAVTGSTTLNWVTPLSAAIAFLSDPNSPTVMAMLPVTQSWATRSKYTDAMWTTLKGVPYEVMMQMTIECNIDLWSNIPAATNYADPTFATKHAQLAYDGTGTTLPGFTGIPVNRKLYIEYSNEVWNGFYKCFHFANAMGMVQTPAAGNIYYAGSGFVGVQTANIADATAAVYGAAYGTRATVSMGCFFSDGDYIVHAMNAPDWVALGHAAPYTRNIRAIHSAPYFPGPQVSQADALAIMATAVPLDTFFGLMYSGSFGGTTYASAGTGFLQSTIDHVNGDKAFIAAQPWATLPLYGYEGGTNWIPSATFGTMTALQKTAWTNFLISVVRDPRIAYVYYDPGHVLSSHDGFLPTMKALGYEFLNMFELITPHDSNNTFGLLENVQQPASGVGTPYKYAGVRSYIGA